MEGSEAVAGSSPPAEGSASSQLPPPAPPSQPPAAPVALSSGGEEKTAGPAGEAVVAASSVVPAPPEVATATAPAGTGSRVVDPMKKKRGRPRKYAPDGSLVRPLNATPISASVPGGVKYTPVALVGAAMKRGRGRPVGLVSKSPRYGLEFESLGEMVAAGANFTPHIITVAPGEDVTKKVISFSQQGPRAICILSANGIISNVTLRQPDSSGGTLTYEGRFELLSLSGSFMPTENGGTKSRSGGLSVSLASPDGRVVGGGVAGQLLAAGPVQVVVGSFLPSYQMEQKVKKQKLDPGSASVPTPQLQTSHSDVEESSGQAKFNLANKTLQIGTQKLDPGSASVPTPALQTSHSNVEESSGQAKFNLANKTLQTGTQKLDPGSASVPTPALQTSHSDVEESLGQAKYLAIKRLQTGAQNSTDINLSLPAA